MKEEKTPKAELMRNIARAMMGDPTVGLPQFPVKYHTVAGGNRVRLYLRETEPSVVEFVHEINLVDEILRWVANEVVGEFYEYQITPKEAIEVARMFRGMSQPMEKIHNVLPPNRDGMTFRRLPWDIVKGPTPTFDEMLSRVSNAKALMCFTASLLVEDSDMQQYLWAHGSGQDGKGAYSRFLHKVLGNAYSSQEPPTNGDKFWTSMVMGKRLVVFPDCNNQTFVTSGRFKSLTGGDPVRIEQKGQPATTAILTAKYMFLSNERPALSSEIADLRRVIYCEFSTIPCEPDPGYEAKLWAEGGAYLAKCWAAYAEACPRNGKIPVEDVEQLRDWVSTIEEDLETIFDRNFRIISDENWASPTALQERLNEIWPKDRRAQMRFMKWLESTHGVRKISIRVAGKVVKGYRKLEVVYGSDAISTAGAEEIRRQEEYRRRHCRLVKTEEKTDQTQELQ